jgi:hypothetical protein
MTCQIWRACGANPNQRNLRLSVLQQDGRRPAAFRLHESQFRHFLKCEETGAGEAIRTPDPNLGKVVLYP